MRLQIKNVGSMKTKYCALLSVKCFVSAKSRLWLRLCSSLGPSQPPWCLGIPSAALLPCSWRHICPGCASPPPSTTAYGETTPIKKKSRGYVCDLSRQLLTHLLTLAINTKKFLHIFTVVAVVFQQITVLWQHFYTWAGVVCLMLNCKSACFSLKFCYPDYSKILKDCQYIVWTGLCPHWKMVNAID